MAGAKGRPRRMDSEHSTYNVLLPETTITAIRKKAESSGVSSAQVVRDVLADGFGRGKKKPSAIKNWCDAIKIAMQTVREAYPVPKFADGKTLGDQIAGKIEAAYHKKR
jgi:hypothetical protein